MTWERVVGDTNARNIADIIHNQLNQLREAYEYMQWYLMVIDAVEFKLYRETTVKHKRKPSGNVFKVYFCNKAIELFF